MANSAHLVRRQSSRDLNTQRSLERYELKEMKTRRIMENGNLSFSRSNYGTTAHTSLDSNASKMTQTLMKSTSSGLIDPKLESKPIFHPENGEEERESWDSKLTFLLATIGYAVGLGNVWRFPYLAQKNGGGAFLIPYFIMLAIEGIPIFYLELAIGQRLRKGAIGVWSEVSPYLAGIGISSAVVSFNVALYYNTIIAWCIFYFVQSFQTDLPWATCPNIFFPNGSYTPEPECVKSTPTQYFWYRTTLMISENINNPMVFNWKIAVGLIIAWILVYLCMIKGIASSGKLRQGHIWWSAQKFPLRLSLHFVLPDMALTVYFKVSQWSGIVIHKVHVVVYVTATFPYIVLVIFFFRGITLRGMSDGLLHLFTPKWEMLLEPVVWLEAGTQIFFSLGLAFGGLIAFSSYNPVNNNCYRDAITVSLTNCFTSMFAAIVVFSIIGFKARINYEQCITRRIEIMRSVDLWRTNTYLNLSSVKSPGDGPITVHYNSSHYYHLPVPNCNLQDDLENTASGTGLAFIIFTEAINQFPGAQFWAIMFFLMLFTLGIDSQFGTLEGVVTSIVDMKLFPNLRKEILTGVLCAFCCAISMCFAHGAGIYVFTLFDNFSGNFPLLIIAFFECVAVSYVYGVKRFSDDIELMVGKRPSLYWQICWKYLSPMAMLLILFASFIEIISAGAGYPAWVPEKGETEMHDWPVWAIMLILFLILISIIWIPGIAVLRMMGIVVIEEREKSWFPADDLREFHGIVSHEVTAAESVLFCIHGDGSEGTCFPTVSETRYQGVEEDFEDDNL